jgi:peptide/nickel transport system substrate-binding protein
MLPPSAVSSISRQNIVTQTALQAIQEWDEVGISQFNTTTLNPARYDTSVRQALARATNKDYIVRQLYYGLGLPGSSLVSPISPWWYNPVAGGDNLTFNIQAANEILNQSGYDSWTGGSFGRGYREATLARNVSYEPPCFQCLDPPNATVTIPAGTVLSFTLATRPADEFPEEYSTAEYLEAQWAEIGVQITIKQETTEAGLATDIYGGNVEMYIWYSSSDPDPSYILSMESSWTLDGWNDNYWNNGTFNQLYLTQMGETNYTRRLADVQEAERIQYDSASYIIYIYPYGVWSMRDDVWTGWGDWVHHPFRQMNAYWGANPLFFSLTCPNCSIGKAGASEPLLTEPLVIGAIAAAVVIVVVAVLAVVLVRHRRAKEKEEGRIEFPPKA